MIDNVNSGSDGTASRAAAQRAGSRQPGDVLPPVAGDPDADGFGDPVLSGTFPADVLQTRCAADEVVLELGAGTGVVSRAMLEGGVPPERLIVVEIVPEMAEHLRSAPPDVQVIEGDARRLPHWCPATGTGG